MKLAIGILVLSTLLFFIKVRPETVESYNFWLITKFVCFLLMIGSFIAMLIIW